MADPNNVPQEADQLKRDIPREDSDKQTVSPVAKTDADKEFEIAQQNENGAGTQSSDPNPVNRQSADTSTGGSSTSTASDSGKPSDPATYTDMAREVTSDA